MTFPSLSLPWVILGSTLAWLIAFVYAIYLSNKVDKKNEWKMPKIKDGVPTRWGWVVKHPENLTLGKNTDIGFGTFIQAEYGISIAKNTQIGAHCSIYSRNSIDNTHSRIYICEGVRIGSGTVIIPKTNNEILVIGKNSKIGALSLIKNNVYEGDIVAGVPAKSITRK